MTHRWKRETFTCLNEQSPTAQEVANAEASEDDFDLGDTAACCRRREDEHEVGGGGGHGDREGDIEEVVERPVRHVRTRSV